MAGPGGPAIPIHKWTGPDISERAHETIEKGYADVVKERRTRPIANTPSLTLKNNLR